MGHITRKQMWLYLNDKLYLQRCEGGRGLLGPEECVQVEVHSHEKYLSTSKEKILKEVSRNIIIENNKQGRNTEEIHKGVEKSRKKNLFMDSL